MAKTRWFAGLLLSSALMALLFTAAGGGTDSTASAHGLGTPSAGAVTIAGYAAPCDDDGRAWGIGQRGRGRGGICRAGDNGQVGPTRVDRFVSAAGSDTNNDCTDRNNPCLTVQRALDALTADGRHGATVYVLDDTAWVAGNYNIVVPGSYRGTITSLTGDPDDVVIDAGANGRVFQIESGAVVTIQGLTLSGGYANDGGAIYNAGSLTLIRVIVTANVATENGGGVYNTGSMTLKHSRIAGNQAEIRGGGVYNAGTVTLISSKILENNASGDGNDQTFDDGVGGGVYNDATGTLNLVSKSAIDGNTAASHAGGVYNLGVMNVRDSSLDGNVSGGVGGAIYNLYRSSDGGSAVLTVEDSSLSGNRAANGGGALLNHGIAKLRRVTIDGNIGLTGAGIWAQSAPNSTTTVADSTISNNFSSEPPLVEFGEAAALAVGGGVVTVTNTTISGNRAQFVSGAILLMSGSLNLVNVTVTGNHVENTSDASSAGGLRAFGGSQISAVNTLIVGNTRGPGLETVNCGSPVTGTSNLADDDTCFPGGAGNIVDPDFLADGFLGALAWNGGPTQTHALLRPGVNPSVGSGNNAICATAYDHDAPGTGSGPFDQRGGGFPRISPSNGFCDVGAYEYQQPEPRNPGRRGRR